MLNNKKHLKPRKLPTQGRALMTVNAILDAAAHILVRQGYANITTNLVAESAGVSIGSLYQYYPHKEALTYALYQRHCEKMQAVLIKEIKIPLDIFCRDSIQALVQSIVKAHLVEPSLHQRFEEIQGGLFLQNRLDLQGFSIISQHLNDILAEHQEILHFSNINTAVSILMHTVHTLVHEIVKIKRTSDEIQVMIVEITRMVYGYIHCHKAL